MAALDNTMMSLADKQRITGPDGRSVAVIIEQLNKTNRIMDEAMVLEGNLPTGHRSTIRTGLPSGTWRALYEGVPNEKATTVQVDDTCGMLEAYAEVDKALADLNGTTMATRMSQAKAFLEGMMQTFATAFFYANTNTEPKKFMGLAPRFAAHTGTDDTLSSYNVISAGGSGSDNTSVWFVNWDENTCHLIYPRGSRVGLSHDDKGQETLEDASGNKYEGYRDHFKWDIGLAVPDWRGVSRICNIDVSNLNAGSVQIDDFMIDAFYKINEREGRKAIYCNKVVATALHKIAKDKSNVNLTLETFDGKPVVTFLGIPIRQCDQILLTESAVASA